MLWTVEGFYERFAEREGLINLCLRRGRYTLAIRQRDREEQKERMWDLYLNEMTRPNKSFRDWKAEINGT